MSAHLPTMPPRPSGDITITATHREVMRRLDQGESLTEEHVDTLGALYLHDLVDDVPVEGQPFRAPALTDLGRRLLEVHESLPETRRVERPRLESRQMPHPWRHDEGGGYTHPMGGQYDEGDVLAGPDGLAVRVTSSMLIGLDRAEVRAMARDLVELIDWLDHEERVCAQDGAS